MANILERSSTAVQTTLVSVVMAAITGIMGGEIVMLGLIALPHMLRLGYDKHLAIGTIFTGASLATLIPPKRIMIIYGLTGNVSISDLFLGGFLPGLLLASLYTMVRCSINPALAPPTGAALMGLTKPQMLPRCAVCFYRA